MKEAVKETLKGSGAPEDPSQQLSAQSKARFLAHAVRDPETGERHMGPEEFINAVAPATEDYVSWLGKHFARPVHHWQPPC
jgi:solute carrier family 25 aspartate/glutamate transporter 12/13